jgi:hypothetical protein
VAAHLALAIVSTPVRSSGLLTTQVFLGLMTLAGLTGTLTSLYLATGRLFRGYVRISPDGLEYRYWLNIGFRCDWSAVKDRIGKHRRRFPPWQRILYIRGPDWFGPTFVIVLVKLMGGCDVGRALRHLTLPLWGIQGWPNGEFARDLRRYAPHLFEAEQESAG